MEDDRRAELHRVLWASLILTAFAGWGLTLVIANGSEDMTPVAIVLLLGALPAFLSVPLLLATPQVRTGQLAVVRALVWVQAAAPPLAIVLAVILLVAR